MNERCIALSVGGQGDGHDQRGPDGWIAEFATVIGDTSGTTQYTFVGFSRRDWRPTNSRASRPGVKELTENQCAASWRGDRGVFPCARETEFDYGADTIWAQPGSDLAHTPIVEGWTNHTKRHSVLSSWNIALELSRITNGWVGLPPVAIDRIHALAPTSLDLWRGPARKDSPTTIHNCGTSRATRQAAVPPMLTACDWSSPGPLRGPLERTSRIKERRRLRSEGAAISLTVEGLRSEHARCRSNVSYDGCRASPRDDSVGSTLRGPLGRAIGG